MLKGSQGRAQAVDEAGKGGARGWARGITALVVESGNECLEVGKDRGGLLGRSGHEDGGGIAGAVKRSQGLFVGLADVLGGELHIAHGNVRAAVAQQAHETG